MCCLVKSSILNIIYGDLMKIQTINPATEEILNNYDCLSDQFSLKKIEAGREAFFIVEKNFFF